MNTTLVLSPKEIEVLLGLIDSGIRHQGINGVVNAAIIVQKINDAVKTSQVDD